MDLHTAQQYKKNVTHLFIIASLVIAISVMATLLALSTNVVSSKEMPILITVAIWIAVLFGSIVGESRNITLFNVVVSITGFVSSFVLAMSLFVQSSNAPISVFLFWVSQILSAVFILSTYFSIEAYVFTKKPQPIAKTSTRKRKTTK